jgi:hypothetical protein
MKTFEEFLRVLRLPEAPSDYVVTSDEPVFCRNGQHHWRMLVDDPNLVISHEEVLKLAAYITTAGPHAARMADFLEYQEQRSKIFDEQSRHGAETRSLSSFLDPSRRLRDVKWNPDAFDFNWEIHVEHPDGTKENRVFRCHVVFVAKPYVVGLSIFFRTVYSSPIHPFQLGMGEPSKWLLSRLESGFFRPGLILIAGPVGQGKTTTLSALAGWIVRHLAVHLLTIDQPIECFYPFRWTEPDSVGSEREVFRKGLVTQREVGFHTPSYRQGLIDALREVPNVIALGEIRDRETLEQALYASTFGSLVLATLHSPPTVGQAFLKVVSELGISPTEVAASINCIIAQRLLPHADKEEGMVLVQEWALPSFRKDWMAATESKESLNPQTYNSLLPLGIDESLKSRFTEAKQPVVAPIFSREASNRRHDFTFPKDNFLHEQGMDGAILHAYWKRRLDYETAAGAVVDLERFHHLMDLNRETTGEFKL